jgi:hypothetical protein
MSYEEEDTCVSLIRAVVDTQTAHINAVRVSTPPLNIKYHIRGCVYI